ncbi:hypothetical protein [Pseudanabaena sp. FACHB-2040]|uniref:hypothetical protein n=1 Tax=Pseudanabaena sp. FACHB-2040 TaxID=2692859 RepID=UPI0016866F70|nr:hypothetical protein [Pseudanabaena sp. FACHB-2040]MBD2260050.1 hypothetical protein [Pseudanabaena sp. FACHB-2040]
MSSTDFATPTMDALESLATPESLTAPSIFDLLGLSDLVETRLSFDPSVEFLNTYSLLGLLNGFSPELAGQAESFLNSTDEWIGQITVDQGIVTADVTFPEGKVQESVDVPAEFRQLAELGAATNGAISFGEGLVSGTIISGDSSVSLDGVDFVTPFSELVGDFFTGLEGTFEFANGAIALGTSTPFGSITGSVGFGEGALTLDLLTPFGAIASAVDFPGEALIPFTVDVSTGLGTPVSLPGVVDFNQGVLELSLFSTNDVVLPLENFSGTVTLAEGVAAFDVVTPLGNIPLSVEFGPLASEAAVEFVRDLSGSATITNGVIDSVVETPFGPLESRLDLVDLASRAADFAQQTSGSISIADGFATTLLETPAGLVSEVTELSSASDFLNTPLAGLFG